MSQQAGEKTQRNQQDHRKPGDQDRKTFRRDQPDAIVEPPSHLRAGIEEIMGREHKGKNARLLLPIPAEEKRGEDKDRCVKETPVRRPDHMIDVGNHRCADPYEDRRGEALNDEQHKKGKTEVGRPLQEKIEMPMIHPERLAIFFEENIKKNDSHHRQNKAPHPTPSFFSGISDSSTATPSSGAGPTSISFLRLSVTQKVR